VTIGGLDEVAEHAGPQVAVLDRVLRAQQVGHVGVVGERVEAQRVQVDRPGGPHAGIGRVRVFGVPRGERVVDEVGTGLLGTRGLGHSTVTFRECDWDPYLQYVLNRTDVRVNAKLPVPRCNPGLYLQLAGLSAAEGRAVVGRLRRESRGASRAGSRGDQRAEGTPAPSRLHLVGDDAYPDWEAVYQD